MCTECPIGAYLGEDGKCHVRNCKKFGYGFDTNRQAFMSVCVECHDGYGLEPLQNEVYLLPDLILGIYGG